MYMQDPWYDGTAGVRLHVQPPVTCTRGHPVGNHVSYDMVFTGNAQWLRG